MAVIIMVLAIFLGLAQARNTSVNPEYIQSATAINRVLYSTCCKDRQWNCGAAGEVPYRNLLGI